VRRRRKAQRRESARERARGRRESAEKRARVRERVREERVCEGGCAEEGAADEAKQINPYYSDERGQPALARLAPALRK